MHIRRYFFCLLFALGMISIGSLPMRGQEGGGGAQERAPLPHPFPPGGATWPPQVVWPPQRLNGQTPQSQSGPPDMIVYNGKIQTMDNDDFTNSLGTVGQAMSIKNGKILAIGSNSQIRGQAGPNTKQIDLGGRTVMPGMIVVHDHPWDWGDSNPYSLKRVLGNDEKVVSRYVRGIPEEQAKQFPGVLKEAISKAKPGEWVHIVFSNGERYEYPSNPKFGEGALRRVSRAELNQLSPNNPVLLQDVMTGTLVNDRGLEIVKKIYPFPDLTGGRGTRANEDGLEQAHRWIWHEGVMREFYKELREIQRLELSWMAGYGVTAFSGSAFTPSHIKVYSDLDRTGEMSVRNQWGWNWRESALFNDDYVVNFAAWMDNMGSDYFWFGGGRGGENTGRSCSALPMKPDVPANRARSYNVCAWTPGTQNHRLLWNFVRNGGRFGTTHTLGDRDVDYLLEILEKASAEGGITLDEIRAKRHTFDHLEFNPRPDQIPLIKKLGMAPGGSTMHFWEGVPGRVAAYGIESAQQAMPKMALVNAGIKSGFEIDRAFPTTELTPIWALWETIMHRKAWDGNVYAANQGLSRELAMKVATSWGSWYLRREDWLGSLKPGKFADFIVLDRDWATIPDADIPKLRVFMTVVGGRVKHLVPSLAKQWGMQPTGAQVEDGPAGKW
ncbi:MAG: amidohydrolase family protein [Acidobacteria bacterium]|nr:amidohydrolase family protein [Acidobacteriota bacterium]